MSKAPLDWHPATWPWPEDDTDTQPAQLAKRARDLISSDGEFHRNIDGDIVCQMVIVGGWCLTLWWLGERRIEVIRDSKLALRFSRSGLKVMDGPLCGRAFAAIKRARILQDLADV